MDNAAHLPPPIYCPTALTVWDKGSMLVSPRRPLLVLFTTSGVLETQSFMVIVILLWMVCSAARISKRRVLPSKSLISSSALVSTRSGGYSFDVAWSVAQQGRLSGAFSQAFATGVGLHGRRKGHRGLAAVDERLVPWNN
nr:hypothetical protein Iba_chr12aCG24170 [Ipomoea batatas]